MLTASIPDLDLVETYLDSDPHGRVTVAFPINHFTGAQRSTVVYFEVAPGDYLPTHTDSAEEVLHIIAGEGEVRIGNELGRVQAGDLAVVPELVPHSIANIGGKPLKVAGFFGSSEVVSTFEEPRQPMGRRTFKQGELVPARPHAGPSTVLRSGEEQP